MTVHATIWAVPADPLADLHVTPRHRGDPVLGASLGAERPVMVCPPAFRQGPAPLTVAADVARKGMIHVLGRPDHWEAFARHHGLPDLPLSRGPRTDSSNVALEMAAAGPGCAITLASLAAVHLDRGLLVAPFAEEIATDWHHELHPGERGPTRATARLRDFLAAAACGG